MRALRLVVASAWLCLVGAGTVSVREIYGVPPFHEQVERVREMNGASGR